MSDPELTVVIAYRNTPGSLRDTIAAMRQGCHGVRTQITLVHPADAVPVLSADHRAVELLGADQGAVVPRLWGVGLAAARGSAVAFTTSEFQVDRNWARGLLNTLASGASGAGGTIALADRARMTVRATYFLRYSRFMPPQPEGNVPDIAGDNAAYRRETIHRLLGPDVPEFWEVELHKRIHDEGGFLAFAPDAAATLTDTTSFRSWMRHRYVHGQYSGAHRTTVVGHPWMRGVAAAPLVPAVLTWRVLRRAMAHRRTAAALGALPGILPLASAWALGEAVGAWRSRTDGRS